MHDNRYKKDCAPVARPGTTARVPLVLTRRQLLSLGLGGVGVGSALFMKAVLPKSAANSVPAPLPIPPPLPAPLPPAPVQPAPSQAKPALSTFHFDVVTVNAKGQVVSRQPGTAQFFTESLGQGVGLDMVSLPGGGFIMGSPVSEAQRYPAEEPQHRVTVSPFFMGKYAVTQAQWRAVAALPQVNQKLDPAPSQFKGANRPVEQVDWYDAQEFCKRLAQHTGRMYRLPSEAEWEYACRAGTTTPFHFGETLTTALANYDGNYTYASGPKGDYREQTTDVGSFPPNAFGLYDLHGNVGVWCTDHWHDNYQGAPTDGSAWVQGGDSDLRSLRSGCWYDFPGHCRSAYRLNGTRDDRYDAIGFRVCCVPP